MPRRVRTATSGRRGDTGRERAQRHACPSPQDQFGGVTGLILLLVVLLVGLASGCGSASTATPGASAIQTASGGAPTPTPPTSGPPQPTHGAAVRIPGLPFPTPSPTTSYGCPSGPCPSSLALAVNGCSCAGQIYDDSWVTESYCCASGFSNSECPESLRQEAQLESLLGSTEGEIEAHLTEVQLQGWTIQVHELAAPAFRQAAKNIEHSSYAIVEPPESYNYRKVAGHAVLSLHSFGIAVDIDPSSNPACGVTVHCRCNNELITDMPAGFVQGFKSAGFDWGGDWTDHPDPMHFEWNGWKKLVH